MNDVSVLYIDSFRQGTGLKESLNISSLKKIIQKKCFIFTTLFQ